MKNDMRWNDPEFGQVREERNILEYWSFNSGRRHTAEAYLHPEFCKLLYHILLPLKVTKFVFQL